MAVGCGHEQHLKTCCSDSGCCGWLRSQTTSTAGAMGIIYPLHMKGFRDRKRNLFEQLSGLEGCCACWSEPCLHNLLTPVFSDAYRRAHEVQGGMEPSYKVSKHGDFGKMGMQFAFVLP